MECKCHIRLKVLASGVIRLKTINVVRVEKVPVMEENLRLMRGVDLVEANYDGRHIPAPEEDYDAAHKEFQKIAQVIIYGAEN